MAQQKPTVPGTAPSLIGPAPERGRYLKITMFIRKLPDITNEYFHAYWANNHVQVSLANATFASKIRRYNQYHITPELREQAERLGGTVLDFDGAAEFWVETLEDWESIARDPDFVRVVSGDMLNFMREPLYVTLGYDYLVAGKDWDAAPAA
ncbi:dimeric alpha-beta barrel doman containing protein [Colletotrichum tofieldiae]|uniref:Dimeric alpha-beta barrel doman containing protein n=1 Tax=Colletotrichum tofieldiae TaxID=708197 RepID=A0A166Y9Q2_9PEZI|nr:dimeric alpha-beta barrel doman containing protein [Colletotrichum tofieldiae]